MCAHRALPQLDLASVVTGAAIPVDGGHLLLPGFNHAPVQPE
ncbi:hypothetical protein [Streptomyces sp. NPDC093591]